MHSLRREAGEKYYFRTLVKVPIMEPSRSMNAFFFEWGLQTSKHTQRVA